MNKIKQVARHIAIAIRHRLSPSADRHRDIVVRQQCLPAAARVAGIGRHDIGAVDLPRPVVAFEAHDLVRSVGAIEHRHRPGKALPAEMLLAQIAEPDPRLTHKAAARDMDPRARHRNPPAVSRLIADGRARLPQARPAAYTDYAQVLSASALAFHNSQGRPICALLVSAAALASSSLRNTTCPCPRRSASLSSRALTSV